MSVHKLICEKTKANESLGQGLVKWQLKSKLKKESTHKKTTKSSHLKTQKQQKVLTCLIKTTKSSHS